MAWLFLDESGHFSNSDYICIAGYASSDDGWEAFIPEWSALLKKHALPAIHMKDIVSPKGNSPAAQWAMDKKLTMLEEFIQVIQKHVKAGFGVGLKAAHYRAVVKKLEQNKLITNPFHAPVFCLARIIKLAAFHTLLKSSEQAIEIVLDDSEQYSMKFYSYFSKLKQRNLWPPWRNTFQIAINMEFDTSDWRHPVLMREHRLPYLRYCANRSDLLPAD